VPSGDAGEGADEPGQVLAGLDRAGEGDERRGDAEPGQQLGVGVGAVGRLDGEAPVVDAVGDGEDGGLGVDELAQAVGGAFAHRHDGVRPSSARTDHPGEEGDLARLVPLGVVEEREVVDGHHARPGPAEGPTPGQRQGVVGAVPQGGAGPSGHRRRAHLLPDEPERPGTGCGGDHPGAGGERRPATTVIAPRHEEQLDRAGRGERPDQLDDVGAGPGRLGRDGGHVDGHRPLERGRHRTRRPGGRDARPPAGRGPAAIAAS
jgi:hypothetical protein